MTEFIDLPQLEMEPGIEATTTEESVSGAGCLIVESVNRIYRQIYDSYFT
jgi:hypothetical protein